VSESSVPAEGLSLDRVARAALKLIERDGFEHLSMRVVAEDLGTNTMSLYQFVSSKAALLDSVGDVLLADGDLKRPFESDDWRDQLRELAVAFRRTALRYPVAFPLIITRRIPTPAGLVPVDRILEVMKNAGFRGPDAVHTMRVLVTYVMGSLFWETSTTTSLGGEPRNALPPNVIAHLGSFAPQVAAHLRTLAVRDHEFEYNFGVELLIESLEARIDRQSVPHE